MIKLLKKIVYYLLAKIPFLEIILFLIIVKVSDITFFFRKRKTTKKVMVIADFEKFGGTRTYLILLLTFYAKQNIKVSVVVKDTYTDAEMKDYVESLNFDYYVIPVIPSNLVKKPSILKRIFLDIRPVWKHFLKIRPDIIVVSTGTHISIQDRFNFVSTILLPAKYLYIVHSYPWEPLHNIYNRLLIHTLGHDKKILTVSIFAKDLIIKFWKLEHKSKLIEVVYNALPELKIEKELKNEDKITILTLGHTVDYKNPEAWIEVAIKIVNLNKDKNIEFIWAGDGPLLESCRQKIKVTGLSNIHFIGFQKDVDLLYTKADIYFQPSLAESFGLSVLQAMSYGIVCIVTNVGGLPEIVVDESTGYVVETKIEEITEKLNFLISNDELRKNMGKAGLKRYLENFQYCSWEEKMLYLHSFV